MELPENLQTLYKHWNKHLSYLPKLGAGAVEIEPELKKQIEYFVGERLSIWQKKQLGKPKPFTDDPILDKYRFCNIYREFDAQTIVFHTLLKPIEDDFPLWLLNMFYCRFIARPETIESTGLLSFNTEENKKVFKKLLELPSPKYGTPYVFPVSTIMRSNTPTRESFIAEHVPVVIKDIALLISNWEKMCVEEGVKKILPVFGFNHRFLWTEVLIDVAYQYPEFINLFDAFPIGPGSAPTMKRIDPLTKPSLLVSKLASKTFDIKNIPTINYQPIPLSAENWEGIGCEFRKYSNLAMGKGRKRLYRN